MIPCGARASVVAVTPNPFPFLFICHSVVSLMVNFGDPTVVLKDICAHAFQSSQGRFESLMGLSLNSGAQGPLPCHKWCLPVGLLYFTASTFRSHVDSD